MEVDRRQGYRVPIELNHSRLVTFYPIGFIGRVKKQLEGMVSNISVDGLAARIHGKVRRRKQFWVVFNFPGPLRTMRLRAKAIWAEKEGLETRVGLAFLNPAPSAVSAINKLAYDHKVCEAGIAFAMQNVCKRTCTYWDMCRKPIKLPIAA